MSRETCPIDPNRPPAASLRTNRMAAPARLPAPAIPAAGHGVALGFVDYGFDLAHPALRDPRTGRTRFAALWNQNAGVSGFLSRRRIDALLAACRSSGGREALDATYDPLADYYDATRARHGAHGTLMASISAGSSSAAQGPASAATLLGVQLAHAEPDWREVDASGEPTWSPWIPADEPVWTGWRDYLSSRALVDALETLWDEASRRRAPALVINLSLGAWAGAHDGRSPVEQAVAGIAARNAGRRGPVTAVVVCAGNAGADRGHFAGRVTAREPTAIGWHLRTDGRTPAKIELWYDAARPLEVTLTDPWTGEIRTIASGPTSSIEVAGRRCGIADHRTAASGPLSCVRIALDARRFPSAPAMRAATWTIGLAVTDPAVTADVHAWIERDLEPRPASYLTPSSTLGTLSGLACAPGAIVVGGYDHRARPGHVMPFPVSGRGPLPWLSGEASLAPHLVAPAVRITGARSLTREATTTTGTSAAAAFASGVIARELSSALAAARAAGRDPRPALLAVVEAFRGSGRTADGEPWHPACGWGALAAGSIAFATTTTNAVVTS